MPDWMAGSPPSTRMSSGRLEHFYKVWMTGVLPIVCLSCYWSVLTDNGLQLPGHSTLPCLSCVLFVKVVPNLVHSPWFGQSLGGYILHELNGVWSCLHNWSGLVRCSLRLLIQHWSWISLALFTLCTIHIYTFKLCPLLCVPGCGLSWFVWVDLEREVHKLNRSSVVPHHHHHHHHHHQWPLWLLYCWTDAAWR